MDGWMEWGWGMGDGDAGLLGIPVNFVIDPSIDSVHHVTSHSEFSFILENLSDQTRKIKQ